jgi:hypothetical protein
MVGYLFRHQTDKDSAVHSYVSGLLNHRQNVQNLENKLLYIFGIFWNFLETF